MEIDWLNFLGSIIGGLIGGLFTYLGVRITIKMIIRIWKRQKEKKDIINVHV